MDRHDLPGVKLADAADAHLNDIKHQHEFNCKALTYWIDEERENGFCLIEAPNKQAVIDLHNKSHGLIPHEIIEVDSSLVKSFLGRIHDPDLQSHPLTDSAFRALMVIETSNFLNRIEANQFSIFTQKFHNSVIKTFKHFDGRVVRQDNNSYLVSFSSITDAVLCALKIQSNFKYITPKFDLPNRKLKIGICSGDPVTGNVEIFEETVTTATRMCEILKNSVSITTEVKRLYEKENRNSFINKDDIRVLKPAEESFLNKLMDYVETIWNDPEFNVTSFSKSLGLSRSQVYRKLISLTGMSPNEFVRSFRLNRALSLLYNHKGNIQEVAYQTGFNSPTYFTKCFQDKFGILPSKYIQQHGH